jgi:hypothetical protein
MMPAAAAVHWRISDTAVVTPTPGSSILAGTK